MNRWKLFIPVLIFVVLAGMLWRGLYLDPRTLPSVLIDKPLPEFALTSLEYGDRIMSRDDLPDEPFLLNVWGSYCLPCLQENPIFMAAQEQGIIPIVGINYKDRRDAAERWLDYNGNPFLLNVVDEDGRFGIDLGVYGAPETFVVDANGVIRYKHIGVIDYRAWEDEIMPVIASVRGESAAATGAGN